MTCILSEKNTKGCANCPPTCGHQIATSARMTLANVPSKYRDVSMTNSPARSTEPDAYKILDRYVETFKRIYEGVE